MSDHLLSKGSINSCKSDLDLALSSRLLKPQVGRIDAWDVCEPSEFSAKTAALNDTRWL